MLPGIGVFGTGHTVKIIVPFLKEKGFKVEALWGRTQSEASKVAQELDIPFCTTKIDDVLLRKDVDLIFIMCSPNLHAQISVKALGIGKHVLCDQPAGLSQGQALKMVRASQYYPSLISIINHSLRFLPPISILKKALKEGMIGNLAFIDVRVQMGTLLPDRYDWHCDSTMGGGTLTLVGSHIIDLIAYITEKKATRVHAAIRTFTNMTSHVNGIRHISAPDFCCFQMELDGGVLVTASLNNHLNGKFSQEILVLGQKGHLVVRDADLFCHIDKDEALYLDEEDSEIQCNAPIPKPFMRGLYKMIGALREAFLPVEDKRGWIKEPVSVAATFEDGLYIQAVTNALVKSSLNREWVKVNIISEEPDPNPMLSAAVRKSAISM